MKNIFRNRDQRGLTLIELLISIIVGSIVISMLMSILVMSIKVKATFDIMNRISDESFYIVDDIQARILELGPQKIEKTQVGDVTTITLTHYFDPKIDSVTNVISFDENITEIVHELILDLSTNTLEYKIDGVSISLTSTNVSFESTSTIDVIILEPKDECDYDSGTIAISPCSDQGIIKLNLNISIDLDNGAALDPKRFITTIIV